MTRGRKQIPHPDLREKFGEGLSDEELGAYYGVTAGTIEKWRKRERILRPRGAARTDPPHGTALKYRHGCRCTDCRAASAAEKLAFIARQRATGLKPGDPRHGTAVGASNWGCRCSDCRAALAVKNKQYYIRTYGEIREPRWTAEEDAIAFDRSIPAKEAAKIIGRSVSSVYGRRSNVRRGSSTRLDAP